MLAHSALWDCIRALKGRVTVVLTTHCMEEAEALADHIGVMLKERTGTHRLEDAFIAIIKEGQAMRLLAFSRWKLRELMWDSLTAWEFLLGYLLPLLLWITGYGAVALAVAIRAFFRQMRRL